MKKILFSLAIVAILATSCTTADSSEVALVVDQIGNDKGVPNVNLESGFIFYFPPTQDVFTYKTNIQHEEWNVDKSDYSDGNEAIEVTTADSAPIKLDISLNVQLKRESAKQLFINYRVEMDELLNTRVKALVRKDLIDTATLYATDSILQYRNRYEAEVSKSLTKILEKEGFILNNLAVTKLHISDAYKGAIDKKIKVIQETARIKSETEQAVQSALKKVAVAKGNYEAAQFDAKTKEIMSQPKMLDLYRAETDRMWAERGVSPYGSNNVFGTSPGLILNRS